MTRIVVPDDFPPALSGTSAERALRALGDVSICTERGADQQAELIRRIRDADVVLNIRGYTKFSAAVIEACDRLRLISIWGTGTDNVDFAATRAHGITVMNTPGVNANAVAEHTIALMLAVARRIPSMDTGVRAGEWPRGLLVQLEGKTLGIIGLGAIGSRVATLASVFGMTVLASTLGADDGRAASLGAVHVPLETLLSESDFVSLHLRLSEKTTRHLDRARLSLMKPSAFLINTARAGLVDRDALVEALGESKIAGAGLDVFHEEPVRADDSLLQLANVVLTPHNAGSTAEVIDRGLRQAVENIQVFLALSGASSPATALP
jgi:D-3-phosphoglycerate dehydrogenase / 2-oxoglutarate reductase